MFNNVVLDVFIGLIFIFLLYSLLATILQELISSRFGLRARMLQKALRRMLEDGDEINGDFWKRSSLVNYFTEAGENVTRFFKPFDSQESLLARFYAHPSIKYLGEGKLFKKPSYLHAHNFSQTIIQLLRGEEYDGRTSNESELIRKALDENTLGVNPQTLKQFKMLFADARQDSYLFKHKLEDWFEETMDRTTGWYKKQTQVILIWIGFALAIAFNVDTIAITKILLKDKKVREQMVQLAISKQEQYGIIADSLKRITVTRMEKKNADSSITTTVDSSIHTTPSDKYLDSTYNLLQDDASNVMGILGLKGLVSKSDTNSCKVAVSCFDSLIKTSKDDVDRIKWVDAKAKAMKDCLAGMTSKSPYQKSGFLVFIGWLLTALAISLGAPFWFDLLNKFIKLRENGTRPANTALQDKPGGTVAGGNAITGADGKPVTG